MSLYPGKTIFVVDDEPRVLSAIADSVRALGSTVHTFADAKGCLESLRVMCCDLVVTDVNMPGQDGLALLLSIKKIFPLLPVIIISGAGDIPTAVKAVKLGAIDFVEKPVDESSFLPLLAKTLDQAQPAVDFGALTAAERKVLQLVAEGKSNKEIAQIFNRSIRTIENHRHRVMVKLGTENVADMVRVAIAAGILLP